MVGRQNADIADTLHLRDVAIATTFWLSIGYNFGCVIASSMIFDSMGGFSGLSYPMKTYAISRFKGTLPWQPILALKLLQLALCERQRLGYWLWRGPEWLANKMQILPIHCN